MRGRRSDHPQRDEDDQITLNETLACSGDAIDFNVTGHQFETIPKPGYGIGAAKCGELSLGFRFKRFGRRKNVPFRLRSANLETSKSRGLNREARTSERKPPLLRRPIA